MNRNRRKILALAISSILLLMIAQSIYFYGQLPDTVASHFDGDGRPNGWSSKQAFFLLYFIIIFIVLSVFVFLALLLDRIPSSLINIPNRDYWLSEGRRRKTMQEMKEGMMWFGAATLALMAGVLLVVIDANLTVPAQASSKVLWVLICGYALFVLGWLAKTISRYKRRV